MIWPQMLSGLTKKQIGLHVLLQSVNPLFVHAVSLLTVKTLRRWLGISIFIVPSSLYLLFVQYCYIYFFTDVCKISSLYCWSFLVYSITSITWEMKMGDVSRNAVNIVLIPGHPILTILGTDAYRWATRYRTRGNYVPSTDSLHSITQQLNQYLQRVFST